MGSYWMGPLPPDLDRKVRDEIPTLTVIWQCECGSPDCHWVKFRDDGENNYCLHGRTEDGRELILFIDARLGLHALEII